MARKNDIIAGIPIVFLLLIAVIIEHIGIVIIFLIVAIGMYFLFKQDSKSNEANDELENLRDVSNSLDVNFVYLMYDPSLEMYKIGFSKKPEHRERTLQGQRPTIELISKKEYPSTAKARQIEKLLHKKYHQKRTRGEWFKLEDRDVQYIKGYLK